MGRAVAMLTLVLRTCSYIDNIGKVRVYRVRSVRPRMCVGICSIMQIPLMIGAGGRHACRA